MLLAIGLNGYKSFYKTPSVPFAQLTILAGTNSSGKSALFQPLLLMKQTLESPFDPGPLLLEGPNIRITSAEQILSQQGGAEQDFFSVAIIVANSPLFAARFNKGHGGFTLGVQSVTTPNSQRVHLAAGEKIPLGDNKIKTLAAINPSVEAWADLGTRTSAPFDSFVGVRDRCLVALRLAGKVDAEMTGIDIEIASHVSRELKSLIHIPGLRGNPERDYKTTAVGGQFPGTFDHYVASVIMSWQQERSPNLSRLNQQLRQLGLNSEARAKKVYDTRVAIEVSRMPPNAEDKNDDRVSIADVGLGVSQVLPFLVALLVAEKNQVVYVEQPELHLHPASQLGLASVIKEALDRGVQVIIETHSSILLRGIQTAVASGKIHPSVVQINWFSRSKQTGETEVASRNPEADGSLGDWPGDFDEVALSADAAYLDAVAQSTTE